MNLEEALVMYSPAPRFALPSLSRRERGAMAEWPINPAFSRNSKPPALAGGVFTWRKFKESLQSLVAWNQTACPVPQPAGHG